MAKKPYTPKPRLVVYVKPEDLLKIERVVTNMALRNEHEWAGSVIRKALAKI